ncbi:MAG: hypothetical protein JXR76_23755 [Deltaproteobacteria bacterium]|nr:hypothetical protein [Deltaproteobacteria bacterium]MBN2671960.1 hypothetical protein [Deltaproteobacteria bacterium]
MNNHTEELLYSYEKFCELLAHPDNEIVLWSLRHLNRLYYPRIPENIFDVFIRNHDFSCDLAAKLIANRGNLETHGPQLRKLLEELPPNDSFARIADICRQFKDLDALRIVEEKIENNPDDATEHALLTQLQFICECTPEKALKQLEHFSWSSMATKYGSPFLVVFMLPFMPEAILRKAVWACRIYVPAAQRFEQSHLPLIEDLLECHFFARQLRQDWETAEWMQEEMNFFLGGQSPVGSDFIDSLISIRSASAGQVPSVIFEAFEALAKKNKWDVHTWIEGLNVDNALTPFQKWIAQSYIVLDELQQPLGRSKEKDIANSEAALATALYFHATVARDDQMVVAKSDSRAKSITDLIASARPQLFVDFEHECLTLGPDIVVPALVDALADVSETNYNRILRIAKLIPRLEKETPGMCAPLATGLINVIEADLGDFTNEAANRALKSLGGAAIDAVISAAIPGKGDGTEIYLQSVLAAWPCKRVVDAILNADMDEDEIALENMKHIAAPEFIPLLLPHAEWRSGASALKMIDEIHGLSHPDREKWEQTIVDAEARRQAFWERDAFEVPLKPLKANKDKKKKRKQQKKSRKKNRKT